MRVLLIAILFIVSGDAATGQPVVARYDSVQLAPRSFNKSLIDEYKKDRRFQYDKMSEPLDSLWDRFWRWFWDKMDELVKTPARRNTLLVVLIIVALSAIIYFLRRGERSGMFGAQGRKGLGYEVGAEDIHRISFDDAIREAVAAGNYRLAVRLVYLHSLKLLTDKTLIDWKPGKTNSAYVHELGKHPSHGSFKRLTTAFEYAWYGGEEVNSEHYQAFENSFDELKNYIG